MFRFFKNSKPAASKEGFGSEWRQLRDRYADPAIELAKTKQALVVSAASVLDRMWNGNGGGGWGASDETDYIAPLREHLATDDFFDPKERALITQKLDAIVEIGRRNMEKETLTEEEKEDATYEFAGNEVDTIVQATVRWCRRYPDPIPIAGEDEYRGHF